MPGRDKTRVINMYIHAQGRSSTWGEKLDTSNVRTGREHAGLLVALLLVGDLGAVLPAGLDGDRLVHLSFARRGLFDVADPTNKLRNERVNGNAAVERAD